MSTYRFLSQILLRKKAFQTFCFVCNLLIISIFAATQQAEAFNSSESYFTPEMYHQQELSQKVRVSKQINLNQAGVNELKTLPGVDENIALKLIRMRPMEGIRDLGRIPWLPPKETQQLIQGLQGRVRF